MIARLIAFALHQRFITLALALLLGIVSWWRLPIEAYPDVADVQVDVITIWPGRAAESDLHDPRRILRLWSRSLHRQLGDH